VIHEFQLKSSRDDALRVDITAMDARVTLNLKHILLRMGGRTLEMFLFGNCAPKYTAQIKRASIK